MFDKESLYEMWEKDMHLNEKITIKDVMDTMTMRSKYDVYYREAKEVHRVSVEDYNNERAKLIKWLNNECTGKELDEMGRHPCHKKPKTMQAMEDALLLEESLIEKRKTIDVSKLLLETIDKIFLDIKDRSYLIKVCLDHEHFLAGE